MKRITNFIILIAACLSLAFPLEALAAKADVDKMLQSGGLFRIKNRTTGRYVTENASNQLMGQSAIALTRKPDVLSQVWIIENNGSSYSIRNAATGRFIIGKNTEPLQTAFGANTFYIKYSEGNNATQTTNYVNISWKSDFSGKECMNENPGTQRVLGWYITGAIVNGKTYTDNNSDWILEKVTNITNEEIKAAIQAKSGFTNLVSGDTIRLVSALYGSYMTETTGSNSVTCMAKNNSDFGQYWIATNDTTNNVANRWQLRNLLTGRHIQLQNGARSALYTTTIAQTAFTVAMGADPYISTYSFEDASGVGLHCDAGAKVVGWYVTNSTGSLWLVEKAVVDQEALSSAQLDLAGQAIFNSRNNGLIRVTLQAYFQDLACTTLKPEFQAMSDADLKAFMTQTPETGSAFKIALPESLQEWVLKVKNNTWSYREREFRIYDYKPYSDGTKWNAIERVGTGAPFSPQTGPTGVSGKRGNIFFVLVGDNIPVGTTLYAMVCGGLSVTGTQTRLYPGFNVVYCDVDGHLYINYVITNVNKKIAEVPSLPIHIEGGYVNGVFDITRGHTNADWLDMKKNLFKDQYIHLKSNFIQFNLHYDQLLSQLTDAEHTQIDRDGTPKGIVGVLKRWDDIIASNRAIIGAEQFDEYNNCYFSASSSSTSNPYATSFGTYYPGVGWYMNYRKMTTGEANDHGAGMWVVAHETGHNHQYLINLPGDTEKSVNFFSQVARWHQASNVGRGGPWQQNVDSFYLKKHYSEYDIWQRSRMYFQLWLYYQELGNRPNFWPDLCNLFRKDPMTMSTSSNFPMNANENFFKFVKNCADIAKEDLSEFFEFWGFFRAKPDGFMVDDYSKSYHLIRQADIDACKAYMSKYPKAHPGLMFIDERIRRMPANNPGMATGATRLATTPGATPGVASEVGDVGMYSDFRKDMDYQPYTATAVDNVVKVDPASGKGAVGFKVYDTSHNLVYFSNRYNFTLPKDIADNGYYVVAAYGNGTENSILDKTNVTAIEAAPVATEAETPAKIYDLDGRRSTQHTQGVKIVNGKLVVK